MSLPAPRSATSAGYSVIGEPRREPKHFEILGKLGRAYQELHIEPDGEIRKIKLVSPDDHKWHSEIEGARAA